MLLILLNNPEVVTHSADVNGRRDRPLRLAGVLTSVATDGLPRIVQGRPDIRKAAIPRPPTAGAAGPAFLLPHVYSHPCPHLSTSSS
jgi:hypothetical protein